MTDLESEYGLLLARNNVLSERISELEEDIVCLTTDAPLNERLLTQRRTITALQAKLARVELAKQKAKDGLQRGDSDCECGGCSDCSHRQYVEDLLTDILQALEQDDEV